MTERDIAKSVFEFVRELDKKYCKRMSILFKDYVWDDLTLRQWSAWVAVAKWHKKEMARQNTRSPKRAKPRIGRA